MAATLPSAPRSLVCGPVVVGLGVTQTPPTPHERGRRGKEMEAWREGDRGQVAQAVSKTIFLALRTEMIYNIRTSKPCLPLESTQKALIFLLFIGLSLTYETIRPRNPMVEWTACTGCAAITALNPERLPLCESKPEPMSSQPPFPPLPLAPGNL